MPRKSRHAVSGDEIMSQPNLTPNALTRQEFARRMSGLITDKGWSQAEFARRTGGHGEKPIGRDSISNYCNGKAFPTPLSLKQMADTLGVTPHDLLPNATFSAMQDEHPAFELRQAAGNPALAWLRINRAVTFDQGARIVAILSEG